MSSRIFHGDDVNSGPSNDGGTTRSRSLSVIGHDLFIFGDLTMIGGIQIEGRIEGDISASAVTIGETASVQGVVRADEIIVRGSVDGELRARSVALAKTARVVGNTLYHRISIDAGAFIDGRRVRQDDDAPLLGVPSKVPAIAASNRETCYDRSPTWPTVHVGGKAIWI